MAERLTWGLIGTGRISGVFARGLAHSRTGKLLAVASRTREAADRFGQEHNVPRCYGSYEALLADKDVQAVYVSTPHPMHAEWAVRAAEAGKHVLCEKPIGVNHTEATAIIEAARKHDVFLMEAFMYRCHPQTHKLIELVRGGIIGQVRVIHASFSFHATFKEDSRIYDPSLAGGGVLDVGCYCTSMSRLIAGVATGKDFAEPIEVKGVGHLGSTGVDEYASAVLKFPGDIIANLATGIAVTQDNAVRIFGTKGYISVPWPWIPNREGGPSRILLHKPGQSEPQEIIVSCDEWLYGLEADTVARDLDRRQATPPAMTWDDTLGNMKTLDRWREAIGLVYEFEKR
ncbi:MAG: Gfo/Idh/MocA family oxidoreductase [Phycisphaerae bacterium]|nr:Gfo/Idh/MocA family oxidoreductase [Phycisphaerae bacterium]